MSRNNGYNNTFDEDDDGEAIEITDEEAEASDDQGREEAAACVATMRTVRGRHRLDEEHRRMWFRMAKKTLAEGAERRSAAEAAEKARVVAEERAERERVAREAKEQRHRERFERSMRESDERWERLDDETRQENAAWEAGREEREAAAARAAPVAGGPTNVGRGAARSPTTATTSNVVQHTATKATAPATMLKPASPTRVTARGPDQPPGSPSAFRADQGGSRPSETKPSGYASRQTHGSWSNAQPRRVGPDRRVAPPPPPQVRPRRNAPIEPTAPKRPASSHVATPITRAPAPVAANDPSPTFASPSTAVLTGADLAAWRSARGLTQRPAAELLGVAPSTVAKAELLPSKALGDLLQVALAVALGR